MRSGQRVYKAISKENSLGLKKGDHIYLDNFHKNHYEVFNKRGEAKSVLNLDGTINASKSQKALDSKRTIDLK